MESTETLEPEEFHLAHNPCSSDSLKDGHHRPEEYLVADNVKYAPNKKKGGNLALRGAPGLSHLFSVGPTSNASVGVSRPSSVMDFANNSGKISYGQDNPQEHNTMLPVPTDVISSPILQPATAATIGQAFMDKDYHFSTLGPSAHRSGDITRPAKYTNISYLKKFLDTGDIPESSSSSDTDTDSGTDNESIASSADESDEPSNASFDSNVPGKHPHYQGSEYRPQQLNPPGISPERQPLLSSRDQWPENGAVESLPQTMMASGRRMMAAPDTSKRSSSSSLSKNRQSHASPPLYQLSGHDSSGYPYARHRRSSGVASSHGHSQSRSRRRKGSRRHSHTSREALFLDKTGFMDTSYRFTFFNPEVGTVRARDLDDLRTPTYTLVDLLELDGCFWLDVMNPTQNEMRTFGIHALTVEDIMTQDSREKCEVHMNYYFICFRSFVSDPNSEFYMHPINMYNIVLRNGIISFHAEPTPHQQNVLRRIRHLMDQVIITPDDITDQLAPIIRSVEFEVESIDELVLILSSSEQSDMLLRIGSVRKKTMLLLRLLQGKADVVRALIKRFESATAAVAAYSAATAAAVTKITPPPHNPQAGYQAKVVAADPSLSSYSHQLHDNSYRESSEAPPRHGFNVRHVPSFVNNGGGTRHGTPLIPPLTAEEEKSLESANMTSIAAQKGHEIRLYLGDILDHIVTMVQNTNHYEAVISRAHSNYLAKISIELTETSNRTNDVVAKLSALASILVPLNVVTGLWGMNVPVPGQETTDLTWFLGILAAIVMFALLVILISRRIGIV
ncbi:CorA metal ion transporter [Mycoemilia scoparia]|uniref:CorA metal ion transporter n=1 Tax=Mycoemilia scoparia TaxID=417184 RepID=A0A9W8A1G8_9FUNG|nr:CorA metal ion transporter [Mycoemilia scoparia]